MTGKKPAPRTARPSPRALTLVASVGLLATCILLGGGCGGSVSIALELPQGNTVPQGGSIPIRATVGDYDSVPDGSTVLFRTDLGSFVKYGGTITSPVQEVEVPTVDQVATATLFGFPGEAGQGTVTATFESENGKATAMAAITVIGGTRPNGRFFNPRCDTENVSALIRSADGLAQRNAMKIRCELRASDILGDPIPKTGIQWLAEEGCAIRRYEEDGNQDLVIELRPDCDPLDVEPMTDEPNRMKDGLIQNPRDGLLTLIFYVNGEEGYIDANGNKQYDPGENFAGFDLAEPFVDANDNRTYDNGIEMFIDANQNGVWDPPNGRWDGDTLIWAATRITFSGEPDPTWTNIPQFSPASFSIANCGSTNVFYTPVDRHFMPLAAHGEGQGFELESSGNISVGSGSGLYLAPNLGVRFYPDGSIITESFLQARTYGFQISDADCENPNDNPPEAGWVSAVVRWTTAFEFDDFAPITFAADLGGPSGSVD
jgi:hypothetical protein